MEDWDMLPLHRDDGAIIPLAEIVEATIEHAITFCRGDVSRAAQLLGIGRSVIYRRRKKVEKAMANDIGPIHSSDEL